MPRFLTLADVAEILNVSAAQAYALVRSGEVPAIQVGGRGQWRVEEQRLRHFLENFVATPAVRKAGLGDDLVVARVDRQRAVGLLAIEQGGRGQQGPGRQRCPPASTNAFRGGW